MITARKNIFLLSITVPFVFIGYFVAIVRDGIWAGVSARERHMRQVGERAIMLNYEATKRPPFPFKEVELYGEHFVIPQWADRLILSFSPDRQYYNILATSSDPEVKSHQEVYNVDIPNQGFYIKSFDV